MLIRKNDIVFVSMILLIGLAIYFFPFKLKYQIETRGLILPSHEWSLVRSSEGNLISTYKDNVKGTVNSFGVTEFQRGDVVEFELHSENCQSGKISSGDTVGKIYSNEQERNLIQLIGELKILNAEYIYYTTGKKPEDVTEAKRKLELLKQDLITQKKLTERVENLFLESVISDQEYEISLNDLKLKELQAEVAEAHLFSVSTGDKPEMAELVKAKIEALDNQIKQLKNRFDFFTVTSPISGMVVSLRGSLDTETVIKVVDTSSYVVLAPFELKELPFVKKGQEVCLNIAGSEIKGKVQNIDNVVQVVGLKQALYATVIVPGYSEIMPGQYSEVSINTGEVTLAEYIKRIFRITF